MNSDYPQSSGSDSGEANSINFCTNNVTWSITKITNHYVLKTDSLESKKSWAWLCYSQWWMRACFINYKTTQTISMCGVVCSCMWPKTFPCHCGVHRFVQHRVFLGLNLNTIDWDKKPVPNQKQLPTLWYDQRPPHQSDSSWLLTSWIDNETQPVCIEMFQNERSSWSDENNLPKGLILFLKATRGK